MRPKGYKAQIGRSFLWDLLLRRIKTYQATLWFLHAYSAATNILTDAVRARALRLCRRPIRRPSAAAAVRRADPVAANAAKILA